MIRSCFPSENPVGRARALLATGLSTLLVLSSLPAPAFALESGEPDPAAFNLLLAEYVTETGVDYAAWAKAGTEGLDTYLGALETVDLARIMGKEPRGAILINAYNAWSVRQILEHWPVSSIKEIPGFFDTNSILIAGEQRTLDAIAATLGQTLQMYPDYPFALAPGARGLPALQPEAYVSDTFGEQLTRSAESYLRGVGEPVFDREANVIYYPPGIPDNREMYEAQERKLLGYLSNYMSLSAVVELNSAQPAEAVLEIDWSINTPTLSRDKEADSGQ